MKVRVDERGQVLIVSVLCMTVLIGFVALAVDVGLLFRAKRKVQLAADAGALAASEEIKYGSATAAALAATAQNGMTNGESGVTVTVNNPPQSGSHAVGSSNASNYVEVIVTQSTPTFFMRAFNRSSQYVTARAVGALGASQNCIFALSSSGTSIAMSNGASISVPACSVLDDSTSGAAATLTGGTTINALSTNLVGGYTANAGSSIGTVTTGITPVSNPLQYLDATAPNYAVTSCTTTETLQGSQTFTPTIFVNGYACYGSINMNYGTNALKNPTGIFVIHGNLSLYGGGTQTIDPGLYYVTGAISVSQGASLSATGVTFYSPVGGSVSLVNGGSVNVSAPTSGTYNGILFWQAQGNTNPLVITQSTGSTLKGTVYAPSAQLQISGGVSANMYFDIVVNSMTLTGGGVLKSYESLPGVTSPIQGTMLVE